MVSFLNESIVLHTFWVLAVSLISDLFIPIYITGLLKIQVPFILLFFHFACEGTALAGAGSGGTRAVDFFLILIYSTS